MSPSSLWSDLVSSWIGLYGFTISASELLAAFSPSLNIACFAYIAASAKSKEVLKKFGSGRVL
jgi:hypothetical protein